MYSRTLEAWWLSCKQLQWKGTKSPRGSMHSQQVAVWRGADSASPTQLLCQGQWLDRNLQRLCFTSHTNTPDEESKTSSHTAHRGGARSWSHGFSLLWLRSAKIQPGIEHCICHSKMSCRAHAALRAPARRLWRLFLSLWWMRWALVSFYFPFHFRGRPYKSGQTREVVNTSTGQNV